jgi:hypothetical protein
MGTTGTTIANEVVNAPNPKNQKKSYQAAIR